MSRPWLVVISGPPCSGKSLLASRLAADTGWPVVDKDSCKEILFEVLGTGDAAWSRRLSVAAFRIQFAIAGPLLDAGKSLLLEGNFSQAEHAERLTALAAGHARLLQVACRASEQELAKRHRQRAGSDIRHPGHLDRQRTSTPDDLVRYQPMSIAPTIVYDSTAGVEGYAGLVRQLQRAGVPVAR
jgi:predicted kinase